MSQTLRTRAIVLQRTNYGEADRILQVLTPDNGKLSVMARGVRKEKSRLAGGIELFAICDMNLTRGSKNVSEMWTLTGSKLNTFFAHIMTEYDKLQFGYDVIKRISTVAKSIDESEVYYLLADTLEALNDTRIILPITETWFYLRYANLLGEGLNLATDDHGMKLVEDATYNFDIQSQSFSFSMNGQYDEKIIKVLRILGANGPLVATNISGINDLIENCRYIARSAAKI